LKTKGERNMELFYKGILIGIAIGVVGVMFAIPIMQQLQSVIVNSLEIINGYATRNVTKRNAEISLIQADVEEKLQPVGTSCMGFEVPNDEYVYGDECDKTITDRCPIGFN
jgi:hypothetical protein